MQTTRRFRRWIVVGFGIGSLLVGCLTFVATVPGEAKAGPFWPWSSHRKEVCSPGACSDYEAPSELGGAWYWLRSPEEEKRIIAGHYNRYCVRCHGVDGRGVWDIPDVPDFTNVRWQECRSDAQLARIIIEGRGAVMPPFRGTLTLEEAWAMARYLRTFVPGTEVSRPDLKQPEKLAAPPNAPNKPENMPK